MSNPTTKKIFVVDEHPVIVSGLRGLIESHPGWSFAGSSGSCDEATRRLGGESIDLIVFEPAIGGMDGLGRLDLITAHGRVLCFSSLNEQLVAERALRAGARGYLMKTQPGDDVVAAMRSVLDGAIALSPDMRRRLIVRIAGAEEDRIAAGLSALSNRELQIVHLIGFNRNSRQIAQHMHVSEKTVATHRLRIREKLSLRSTNDLVRIAARWVEQDALS